MLRGNGLYVIAAGLVALCLSMASAHENERVRLNDTILECRPPHGCFVVETYVVERQSEPEQENDDSTPEDHEDRPGKEHDRQINIGNLSIEPVDRNADGAPNDQNKEQCCVTNPNNGWWNGLWAAVGPLAAWVAAWLVWLTYRKTRQELQATRETQEAQVRAYVTASGGEVSSYESFGEAAVSIDFMNTGNSPARDVVFYAQVIVMRFDTLENHLIRSKLEEPLKISEIAAREKRSGDAMFFIKNHEIATQFREGLASVKVGGNLYFTDDFGKRRKVKIAVAGFVTGNPDEIGVIRGELKPVNTDLWSKKHLKEIDRRRRRPR